jgi:Na+/H+ antiporter NhaD/arsenite permease-like protein
VQPLAVALLAGTVGGVIVRQLLQRGPPIWVIFGVGALATVGSGELPLSGASGALLTNLPVLLFLLALFLFAAALERSGALDRLARRIIAGSRSPAQLPALLFVTFAALSTFILNDALVLIGVPLVLSVARRLRTAPEPLLLSLACSVTVGSVLTPFSNPQNLLVALESGLRAPVAVFLELLLLPTLVNILLGAWLVRRLLGRQVRSAPLAPGLLGEGTPHLLPEEGLAGPVRRHPVLALFPATIAALLAIGVAAAFTGGELVPLYLVALVGALLLLLVSPGRRSLLTHVNWTILLLFAGLFVVVAGAVHGGVLTALEAATPGPAQRTPATAGIVLESLLGSQLVSNVPWVGLQIPALHSLGYGAATPWAWAALAAGSTLAGNLTLLGAASNLIVVEQAGASGVRIGLREFVRVGAPLTLLTVAVLLGFLWVGL